MYNTYILTYRIEKIPNTNEWKVIYIPYSKEQEEKEYSEWSLLDKNGIPKS